jgi:phage terminase large subunit-like protein
MSPCGDQHDYACKVLDGVLEDDAFFAFIAHADAEDLEGEGWLRESTWRKANPNFGVSVRLEDLRNLATKARHMPPAAAAFKQKRLNVWVMATAPWLSLDGWRHGQAAWCASRWAIPEALHGRACWLGIDMSSKIDLTAVVAVFPPEDGARHWTQIVWCLTPAETLKARALRDRAPYPQWVEQGFLRTNPGNRIDQAVVRAIVHEAGACFDVQQIGFDPWNAGNLEKELSDDGYQVVEVPQNLAQMSGPAKDFEADVLDGLVDGGGNPLLTWCASNVVVQRDNKDNIYPAKRQSRGRIDPIVAGLIARKLATLDTGAQPAADPDLVVA